jgi:hypothetical protein
MTLEELGGKLKELDRTRELGRAELERLRKRRERGEELEQDRNAVMDPMRGCCPRCPGRLVGRGEEEALRDAPVGGCARAQRPGGHGTS